MKNMKFYKEYNSPQDKRQDQPNGNVIATYGKMWVSRDNEYFIDAFGAVYFDPNSPCVYTTAQVDWIRENCKRISDADARTIHPRLFERIED
jgi:hypothetical protein